MRDGMLQPVRTNGDALELHGQPFRERAENIGRTGAPVRVVTAEHVPGRLQVLLGIRSGQAHAQVLEHRVSATARSSDRAARAARSRAAVVGGMRP